MTYLNPVLAYGLERFAADAAAAGADGAILVDLPAEEAAAAQARRSNAHGLDLIFLVAPTSTRGAPRADLRAGVAASSTASASPA